MLTERQLGGEGKIIALDLLRISGNLRERRDGHEKIHYFRNDSGTRGERGKKGEQRK